MRTFQLPKPRLPRAGPEIPSKPRIACSEGVFSKTVKSSCSKMSHMPSLIDAVKRPFSDLKMSGLFFVLSLPPISFISFPWVYGYVFATMRHVADARPGLPDWDSSWTLFKEGVLFLVFAAVSVLPGYLFLVLSSSGVQVVQDPALKMIISVFAYLLLILGSIAFPALMLKVARDHSWLSAFHPFDAVREVFSPGFFIAWAVSLVVATVLTVASLSAVAVLASTWAGLALSSVFVAVASAFSSLFTASALAQSVARPQKKSGR